LRSGQILRLTKGRARIGVVYHANRRDKPQTRHPMYDLATIQRLLGHGDVKTTMIYVQTVPSQTLKEAKSPLDL